MVPFKNGLGVGNTTGPDEEGIADSIVVGGHNREVLLLSVVRHTLAQDLGAIGLGVIPEVALSGMLECSFKDCFINEPLSLNLFLWERLSNRQIKKILFFILLSSSIVTLHWGLGSFQCAYRETCNVRTDLNAQNLNFVSIFSFSTSRFHHRVKNAMC
jgi:hypothetical protein